ncbi:phage tail assembly protein T, partial [Escherichia coli]
LSLFFSDPDLHPLDFSLLNRREVDDASEDDVLMQKAAGLAGGVRFDPDGNEIIPTPPDVADMTEDDLMLMTVSEGIAGGVRYG